jgi:hypothetical protein
VLGVLGAGEDGKSVYFTATAALAGGAEAGAANLYLWREGEGLRFVATLASGDANDWTTEPESQTARATPDGSALAFLSKAPLTGYDNTDQQSGEPDAEAYLYDAEADQLACVSCNPTGQRPIGPAKLPGWSTPFQQPRYLSDSGDRRLFFMSSDALDLHDTNKRQDVYEFERPRVGDCGESLPTFSAAAGGCIALISSGTDSSAAIAIDASTSGEDTFFATAQRLVGTDVDGNYDIYDARVGGGFGAPTPPPLPCTGESCRPPAIPPAPPVPGSSGYEGEGNVPAPRHKKTHHHKRHKHHKKAQRQSGRAVR